MFVTFLLMVVGVELITTLPTNSMNTEGQTIPECQNQQSDIYFLLDSSSSMMRRDFEKLREFVVSFVKKLDIAPNTTRVGLGVFSDDFYGQFDLGQHREQTSLVKAIRKVAYYGGGTYTGKGLRGLRMNGFRDGAVRENATKIGVVVTDGRSRLRSNTILEAAQLKDKGVWLFAIGVGSGVDKEELSIFGSEPKTEFLRHVATFDDLSRLTRELAVGACGLLPPHADQATCGRDKKADIIFVYNAAAMSVSRLTLVKAVTEALVQNFSMTSGNVRVGIMSEGRQGGDIALSQFFRQDDFIKALQQQPRSSLGTLLSKLRQQGYETSYGSRPNSKKFAIVFVDDVDVSNDALVAARMLTYSDVTVYVIAVGLTGDTSKVQRLASTRSEFLSYENYTTLLQELDNFITMLCRDL